MIDELPMVGSIQETINHYKAQIEMLQEHIDSPRTTGYMIIPVSTIQTIRDAYVWSVHQLEMALKESD